MARKKRIHERGFMKIFKRVLIWFCILFLLALIAMSFYVKMYGKKALEQALTDSLDRKVTLGEAAYQFPWGMSARDVVVARSLEGGEFLTVERLSARLSPRTFMTRTLVFDMVVCVRPLFVIERLNGASEEPDRRYGVVVPPDPSRENTAGDPQAAREPARQGVFIDQLIVKEGRAYYMDAQNDKKFSFNLEDLQLKANSLVFPMVPGRSAFDASARLVKEDHPLSGSDVRASGWVDAAAREMEGRLEIVEPDGNVGLTAEAVSVRNEMKVNGEIRMQNLLSGIKEAVPAEAGTVNDLILNALSSNGVEIGAQFSFKTKMDDFKIEEVSFSGNVVTK